MVLQHSLLLLGLFSAVSFSLDIPQPTGRYQVGRRKEVINFLNSEDPLAPGNVSTSFLATLFYPTLQKPQGAVPYLDPSTAKLFEDAWDITPGAVAALTSSIQRDAPFLPHTERDGPSPVLLFEPGGGGPPSECYSILLSQLASEGYVVAALDHPYEQPFVRYPNGTGIFGLPVVYNFTLELGLAVYNDRLSGLSAFMQQWPALVSKLRIPAATSHFGLFGHSLGGSASIGVSITSPRSLVTSAMNMDGPLFGQAAANDTSADAKRPVLLLGQQLHTPAAEPTWGIFPAQQSGWWRTLLVNGTGHLDFSDATFWKELGPSQTPEVGTIDGQRSVQVVREFVSAFFNQTLRRQPEVILTTPGPDWADVRVFDGRNGTMTRV